MITRRHRKALTYLSGILLSLYIILVFLNVLTGFDSIEEGPPTTIITEKIEIVTKAPTTVKPRNLLTYQSALSVEKLCYGKGIRPKFPKGKNKVLKHLDYRTEKFNYLENYKNPCFYRNVTFFDKKILKKPILALRCVPYFFIIGMPKSGTTDVWHGLELHPGVVVKHMKEPMFFTRRRYPKASWPLDQYLDHFHTSSKLIESSPSPDQWHEDRPYNFLITGEGTVDVSHDNNNWHLVPGNEGCNEPRILNSHYLHHLNPKMKLIFMMRNPIDRVFSDYLYESQFFGYNKTVDDFHLAVLESMANHMTCRMYFTERGCAYNSTLESFKARLRVGMYNIFLEDWLRVFPSDQIMIIKFEDFIKDRLYYLKKVFKYLDLRPITLNEEKMHIKRTIPNTRSKKDRKIGDMSKRTRMILSEFYTPYNKLLSKLLNDKRYMWDS